MTQGFDVFQARLAPASNDRIAATRQARNRMSAAARSMSAVIGVCALHKTTPTLVAIVPFHAISVRARSCGPRSRIVARASGSNTRGTVSNAQSVPIA